MTDADDAEHTASGSGTRAWAGGVVVAATRAGSVAIAGLTTLVAARALGIEGFGVYATGTAIASIVLLFGPFGVDTRYLDGSIDEATMRLRLVQVAVVSTGAVAVAAILWPGLPLRTRGVVTLAGVANAGVIARLSWVLAAQRAFDIRRQVTRDVVVRLPPTIALALVAVATGRVVPAMVGMAATTVLLDVVPALVRSPRPTKIAGFAADIRAGSSYALLNGLFVVYFSVDQAVLGSLGTSTDTGLYRAAYTFIGAAIVVPAALNGDFMRTRLFQAADREAFWRTARSSLATTAVLGGLVTATCLIGAGILVPLLFGDEYRPAAGLLRILALALLPHFLSSWAVNLVVAAGRAGAIVRLQAVLVVVNLVGNLALVPSFGARGSAWMTVVTELCGGIAFASMVPAALRAVSDRSATTPG